MDLKRWIIVDFSGGVLEWGVLTLSGFAAVWGLWFWARQFWRKVHAPEWERYADGWSWTGIALLAAGTFGIFALGIAFIILNAAWYLTH